MSLFLNQLFNILFLLSKSLGNSILTLSIADGVDSFFFKVFFDLQKRNFDFIYFIHSKSSTKLSLFRISTCLLNLFINIFYKKIMRQEKTGNLYSCLWYHKVKSSKAQTLDLWLILMVLQNWVHKTGTLVLCTQFCNTRILLFLTVLQNHVPFFRFLF